MLYLLSTHVRKELESYLFHINLENETVSLGDTVSLHIPVHHTKCIMRKSDSMGGGDRPKVSKSAFKSWLVKPPNPGREEGYSVVKNRGALLDF